MEQFTYLGKPLTNQNSIQEEIKADWSLRVLANTKCGIFFVFQFAKKYED